MASLDVFAPPSILLAPQRLPGAGQLTQVDPRSRVARSKIGPARAGSSPADIRQPVAAARAADPVADATTGPQTRLPLDRRQIAAVIALALAAAATSLFFGYRTESERAVRIAQTDAASLSEAAQFSDRWPASATALMAPDGRAQAQRVVHDAEGRVMAGTGAPSFGPVLVRTESVMGLSGPVGEVVVTRTLWPAIAAAALVGLLTTLIGFAGIAWARAVFGASRRDWADTQPQRPRSDEGRPAARRPETLGPRVDTEERFRIVFDNSLEGIMTLLPQGTVLSCNPAAARIFGQDLRALLGGNLADWVAPCPIGTPAADMPFPVGSYEASARHPDGREFPLEMTVSASRVAGESQLILIMRDITERKATQDRLAYLANYDSLTGLPNRALFRDRLAEAMKRAKRGGTAMGLMFLDLDRFKDVNDSLGHAAGDLLLQHVSQTLTRCLREVDSVARYVETDGFTLARLGGDEFTIILEGLDGPEAAAMIARRILEELIQPIKIEGQEVFISTSIGISLYPLDDTDLDGLVRHTDMAMYRSKSLGRGTYSFYNSDMSLEVAERLSLEASLRYALERNEFVLHYQPKADLQTGQVTGVEALIRWNRPGEGMVPPDRFITMLEDTGLILPVGAWVIRTACTEVASWERLGVPPLTLAVNLSARQFRHQHLIQLIADTLLDVGMEPQRLELEITESQLMEDNEVSRALLSNLTALGVKVAIDDFGTGHSSLSYLKRFNIDTLKIDRSFVREITTSEEDNAIATAVVALGHSLNLKVIAEGVETLHQADCLRSLGCDEIQGYLLSRPLPADQLIAWLKDYPSTRSLLRPRNGRASGPMPLMSIGNELVAA